MALFENYEGRMPQLQPVLDKYGFASWEDLKAYNNSKGVDGYGITEGIQPICFENAKWAYELGAGLEDLGKGLRSMTGTIFSTKAKGVRYLELTEGYIQKLALDANNEVIGYQFVRLGKMMEDIRHGKDPKEAYEKNVGTYGRFTAEQGAVKFIDPREE